MNQKMSTIIAEYCGENDKQNQPKTKNKKMILKRGLLDFAGGASMQI